MQKVGTGPQHSKAAPHVKLSENPEPTFSQELKYVDPNAAKDPKRENTANMSGGTRFLRSLVVRRQGYNDLSREGSKWPACTC